MTGDWRLETGGGESVTTHSDISEKMLVHVTGGHEKRKMTMALCAFRCDLSVTILG